MPSARTLPPLIMTTLRVEAGMSASSCVIITMPTPVPERMSNILLNLDFMTMSSPVMGSSSTSMLGSVTRARAISARRISPRDSPSISLPARSSMPISAARAAMRSSMAGVTDIPRKTSRLPKNPEPMTSRTVVCMPNWLWRSMDTTPILPLSSKMFQRFSPKILMV